MIPRYSPTYSFSDLRWSIRNCNSNDIYKQLRSRLAKYYNAKHVFLLDSGKVAINVLLQAYARQGGVLTPAYSCIAVPQAIDDAGYSPVFIDNDTHTLNINPYDIRKALSPDVTVIMPVHLFGIPWNRDELLIDHNYQDILIVDDAAASFGARLNGQLVGRRYDASILSFHWTKPLSGETGGAILTNNDELANRLSSYLASAITPRNNWYLYTKTMIRKMVMDRRFYRATKFTHNLLFGEQMYEVVPPQSNSPRRLLKKISPFSCALILRQLDREDWILSRRREIAQIYRDELARFEKIKIPEIPEGSSPSWIQFPFLVDDKRAFYKHMQSHGIDITWSYRYACPDTYGMDNFPIAQKIAKSVVSLPVYPSLTNMDAHEISSAVKKY